MSKTITLSSKLPGDEEVNGLDSIADHFLADQTPVLVLAWVVSTKVTRDIETGDEVPTVQLRRVEPIGTPDDVPQAVRDLAADLYERRTGRNPLPIGDLLAPAGDVDSWSDDEPYEDEGGDVEERDVASVADVFGMPDDVQGEA